MRARSCPALVSVKSEPDRVVPALVEALADPDTDVRANGAEALGAFAIKAKCAVPRLLEMRNAANHLESYCVQKALQQINAAAAVSPEIH